MFIHNLRTRFEVNESHVMTSISVQTDNHKTVMPMLLATRSITQHLHKPSINRYNHRSPSRTTSYTWAQIIHMGKHKVERASP
jgi:hypothetical protein